MIASALVSGCLLALVALVGVGGIGGSGTTGFTPSNSSSYYLPPSYTPQKEYPSYDSQRYETQQKLLDQLEQYGNEFSLLLKNFKLNGDHDPGTNAGINLSTTNITRQDWNEFCTLKDTNEEFNIYAGQLLYSQSENYFNLLKKELERQSHNLINRKQIKSEAFSETIYQTALIAGELKLLPQYRVILGKIYSQQEILSEVAPDDAFRIKKLVQDSINNGTLLKNDLSGVGKFDKILITMIQNTIKGSLAFWKWKQQRKYDSKGITLPIMLDNGDNRCWLQTGFYMLYSLTATDNLDELGNWEKFLKYLQQRQDDKLNDRVNTVRGTYPNLSFLLDNAILGLEYNKEPWQLRISLVDVLRDFCHNRYDYNLYNNKEAVQEKLNYLCSTKSNKGNSIGMSIKILRKIFPELDNKKFKTREGIYEREFDRVLQFCNPNPKPGEPSYCLAPIAVRHFIPGLNNENDGIGKDPVGVNCPNQYGEYNLKMSLDGKLQIYELRGIAVSEHFPEFKKVPTNATFNGGTQYTVLPPCHLRSVIKLDASPNWYYCDSNGIYFGAESLQALFKDQRSIMNYECYKNKSPLPANHADLLMYHLIDNKLWTEQSA